MHVDHIVVVRGELGSNGLGVDSLVAWDVIALKDRRESGHVHGQDIEVAAGRQRTAENGSRGREVVEVILHGDLGFEGWTWFKWLGCFENLNGAAGAAGAG